MSSAHLGEAPEVLEALRRVLAEDAAVQVDEQWAVAGAIEVTTTTFELGDARRRLVVEQETYAGVTLRGDGDLVDRIAKRVGEGAAHARRTTGR